MTTEKGRKPWCLCDPGIGPHDEDCPAALRYREQNENDAPDLTEATGYRDTVTGRLVDENDATERGVAQFYGHDLFEHYERGGSLLVVTSDASAIHLEPGDFVIKRMWSTAVMPYVYNEARPSIPPAEETR